MLKLQEATVTFLPGEIVIDLPAGHEAAVVDNRFSFPDRDAPRLTVNIGGKHAITFDPAKHGSLALNIG